MAQLESANYDNLIAGGSIITEPIVIDASQNILRGDILKKSSGKFQKASGAITATDVVVIASENITTDASTTASSIGYKAGIFNVNSMRLGGTSTFDDNHDVLAEKSIYIVKAQR